MRGLGWWPYKGRFLISRLGKHLSACRPVTAEADKKRAGHIGLLQPPHFFSPMNAMTLKSEKKSTVDAYTDEKPVEAETGSLSDTSADGRGVDEALRLVGKERTAQFSDEYNRRLRRKLVCGPAI
jgi:hypothetical protein